MLAASNAYYARNREAMKAKARAYHRTEKYRLSNRARHLSDAYREQRRVYYAENRPLMVNQAKLYRQMHGEQRRAFQRTEAYRLSNWHWKLRRRFGGKLPEPELLEILRLAREFRRREAARRGQGMEVPSE